MLDQERPLPPLELEHGFQPVGVEPIGNRTADDAGELVGRDRFRLDRLTRKRPAVGRFRRTGRELHRVDLLERHGKQAVRSRLSRPLLVLRGKPARPRRGIRTYGLPKDPSLRRVGPLPVRATRSLARPDALQSRSQSRPTRRPGRSSRTRLSPTAGASPPLRTIGRAAALVPADGRRGRSSRTRGSSRPSLTESPTQSVRLEKSRRPGSRPRIDARIAALDSASRKACRTLLLFWEIRLSKRDGRKPV